MAGPFDPELLTKKIGPLPAWAWAGIAIAGGVAVIYFLKSKGANSSNGALNGNTLGCPAGQSPDPTGTFCIPTSSGSGLTSGGGTSILPSGGGLSSAPNCGAGTELDPTGTFCIPSVQTQQPVTIPSNTGSLVSVIPNPFTNPSNTVASEPQTGNQQNNPLGIPVTNPNLAQVFNGSEWVPIGSSQPQVAQNLGLQGASNQTNASLYQNINGTQYFNGLPVGQSVAQNLANYFAANPQPSYAQTQQPNYLSLMNNVPYPNVPYIGNQVPTSNGFASNLGIFNFGGPYYGLSSLGSYNNPVPGQVGFVGQTQPSSIPGVTGHYVTYGNGEQVWVND